MATMNVSVPDRMRDWVQSRIDSGQYASASDYIRDLIRRDQMGQDQATALARMDAAIEAGLADLAAGRTRPADEVFDRLEAKYAAMIVNGAKP
ncbi:type II toxin-antitoxin system ParD family antitoxin [Niveispirillum sp.]|uniref:type II toxin-antitoxin system ParD family antitoxin n=1 Tax=Niveispirillum sp. TaxID=1917217 RepID=UPI001B44BBC0|nr:type II toxin-antitoxin system ParD family antitoxin [Niveispirillum sp.]MBP7339862.1 type II toxin-antitoxin system ParD family antitoxin [Niveispirillum sp.]